MSGDSGSRSLSSSPPSPPHFTLKTLAAGGLAGCVAKTFIGPFDRVKILYQVQNPLVSRDSGKISGVFKTIGLVFRRDGIYGLYRGHLAMLLRIFPYSGINFMSYEQYKKLLIRSEGDAENPVFKLAAGSMAGATSVLFTYPLDIMRARLAYQISTSDIPRAPAGSDSSASVVQKCIWGSSGTGKRQFFGRHDGWSDAFRGLLSPRERPSSGGPLGRVYRGFVPSILGIIPYSGVSFCTFETLKSAYRAWAAGPACGEREPIPVPAKLVCGFSAGVLGQTASYPLDVVRRRMQLDTVAIHYPVYRSIWDALADVWRTQGARGLFVGISINYLKVAPATAISFVTYEFLKEKFGLLPVQLANKATN